MDLFRGIKNIIFDLGGVIVNLDYSLTISAFKALGMPSNEKIYSQFNQLSWFDKYDTGGITSDEFLNQIAKLLSPETTRKQIIDAWNAMLLDLPKERAELLLNLKNRYRTFLLSNTNELHLQYYLPKVKEWYGMDGLKTFFEKDYYSHILGMRKPHVETFQYILRENDLFPSETLFIDDSYQHIVGANAAGLRTYHLQAPETIMDVFHEVL
ncbi:MAG: HAD family phosphatase [Bacteroidales bacterium]|nr:HAD family phosphatase [Bacteroidales bacterium]MCB9013682.1 HAD family phosphatase [Bacteroidales bacterium]